MRSAHGAPALAPPRLSLSMQCVHEAHWHWQTTGGWAGGSELSHAGVHTSSATGSIVITVSAASWSSPTAAMAAELGLEAGSTAAPGAALALCKLKSKQTAPARQGRRVIAQDPGAHSQLSQETGLLGAGGGGARAATQCCCKQINGILNSARQRLAMSRGRKGPVRC